MRSECTDEYLVAAGLFSQFADVNIELALARLQHDFELRYSKDPRPAESRRNLRLKFTVAQSDDAWLPVLSSLRSSVTRAMQARPCCALNSHKADAILGCDRNLIVLQQ